MILLAFTARGRGGALAKQAGRYAEVDGEHQAEFGTSLSQLTRCLELWALVQTRRSFRVLVDGVPLGLRERLRFHRVLDCAARAAGFEPPQTYCTAGLEADPARWGAEPVVPCRLFMARGGLRGVGALPPEGRWPAVQAALAEEGVARCPFLRTAGFRAALRRWRTQGADLSSGSNGSAHR